MSWTFEWAANLHGLRLVKDSLQRPSLAGHRLAHVDSLSRPATDGVDDAAAISTFNDRPDSALAAPAEASAVIDFWRDAGPKLWFTKDPDFDRLFRERFMSRHEAAARGDLAGWFATSHGALALLLLLDQFPRNAFRGTPRMYQTDASARRIATAVLDLEHDVCGPPDLRLFYYLPFAHSENIADQDLSVMLASSLGEPHLTRAEHHREIIRRFGRFPHRNEILSRKSTEEELLFLADGGFSG